MIEDTKENAPGVVMLFSTLSTSHPVGSDCQSFSAEKLSPPVTVAAALYDVYLAIESKVDALNATFIGTASSGLFLRISDKIIVNSELHLSVSGKDHNGLYVEKTVVVSTENNVDFNVNCISPDHFHDTSFVFKKNDVLLTLASFFTDATAHISPN